MLHTANMSPQSVTVTCGHISLVFECSESIALSPALFTPTHSGHFFMNTNTGSKSDFIFMLNQNIYINLRCISSLSDDAITNRYPRKLEIFVCLMAAHMCLATFIFHFIAKILHHSFPCSNHMHDHRVGHCNCIWLWPNKLQLPYRYCLNYCGTVNGPCKVTDSMATIKIWLQHTWVLGNLGVVQDNYVGALCPE